MHRWVKGHAGVSWGQPEGNCLEMRKAIKCSQCYRALCSCRCSSNYIFVYDFFIFQYFTPKIFFFLTSNSTLFYNYFDIHPLFQQQYFAFDFMFCFVTSTTYSYMSMLFNISLPSNCNLCVYFYLQLNLIYTWPTYIKTFATTDYVGTKV